MLKTQSTSQSRASATMKPPVILSMIQGGKQRVHTTFSDTSELIEEFNVSTGVLLLRKTKPASLSSLNSASSNSTGWILEVGDDDGSSRGSLFLFTNHSSFFI